MPPGGQSGLPDVLGFIFAPRKGRGVKSARELQQTRHGRETREREIRNYQRFDPGATRAQASSITASYRRRGYIPETVAAEQTTAEQRRQAGLHYQRTQRARGARGVSIVSYQTNEYGDTRTTERFRYAGSLSQANRSEGARHTNAVHAFLKYGNNPVNVEKILAYEGRGVTDRFTGEFIPFEYDPSRLEFWKATSEEGYFFNPQDYYREIAA